MSLKDKILGRDSLKKKIRELEKNIKKLKEEKRELKSKKQKEENRAKKAISKKQSLNEKINRQEDKIQSLKDKLKKKEQAREIFSDKTELNRILRDEIESLLKKLGSIKSEKEDLFTAFLPKDGTIEELGSEGVLQTNLTLNQLKRLKNENSDTGKVLFYSKNLISKILEPPLPLEKAEWQQSNKFKVSKIREQFEGKIGFIFLSAGGSAVAIFGKKIVDSNIIKSKIKGKHGKGGFSQQRFERKRDEEVKKHMDKVEEKAKKLFSDDLDKIAVSGSKGMVKSFMDREMFPVKTFQKKIEISKIEKEKNLKKAFQEFWKGRIVDI